MNIKAEKIIEDVANSFGISVEDMIKPSRKHTYYIPRVVACKLINEYTKYIKLIEFANVLGRKQHGTVLNMLSVFDEIVKYSTEANNVYTLLRDYYDNEYTEDFPSVVDFLSYVKSKGYTFSGIKKLIEQHEHDNHI